MPPPNADPLAPLRSGELGPLYLIYGRERFLVDRAVDLLRERVLDPRTKDFNFDVFHGKEADAGRIVQAARTLPMMAKRRLVLVRDADEMKAAAMTELVPYVSAPCAETCLVLVAEKVDQRLKLFTAWKKHGASIKLDPLYERQLPGFVRDEARARGVKFEAGAAELLCDEVGADLGQLADAVERLAVFVCDRPAAERSVSARDVDEQVATTRQRSVFELCNAVGEGSRERALGALGSMLGARESGVRIVAMLARHVRQLWSAQSLLQKRVSKIELAQALGIPPFFIDGIEAQARRFDRAAFERMHAALYDADRLLKSSRLDDARLLESLVLELTRPFTSQRAERRA
ncbi:MAG TPA: DNA polymerase III subunit delta [Polyangia bacterium]|nr:DNA polymerase III subunit delta [Polyangia bacterium]